MSEQIPEGLYQVESAWEEASKLPLVSRILFNQGLKEMHRFQDSMNKLHTMAGKSQERLEEISQALLAMADGEVPL